MKRTHTARIAELDLDVAFTEGEQIHTEYAHKYTPESFGQMAAEAGFEVLETWTDGEARFRSFMLAPR